MRLTEEVMLQRRDIIIKTAFSLFCECGIENVPLSAIAKQAKIGESTLYRYFEDKPTLVTETFILLWDRIMSELEANTEDTPNYQLLSGLEQMMVWIESFRQLYQQKADFILFSYEVKLYLLRHNVHLDKFQQDTLMHAVRIPCIAAIEKGKRDGSIPTSNSSEDLFYAIWGAIRGYVVKIVIYDKLYGGESPWEERFEVLKEGLVTSLRSGWHTPDPCYGNAG